MGISPLSACSQLHADRPQDHGLRSDGAIARGEQTVLVMASDAPNLQRPDVISSFDPLVRQEINIRPEEEPCAAGLKAASVRYLLGLAKLDGLGARWPIDILRRCIWSRYMLEEPIKNMPDLLFAALLCLRIAVGNS
jgi:hypothetical protein